ncbi:MAG: site-2 protease family protein, partial [Verrucomicrobiaceae bacterium]
FILLVFLCVLLHEFGHALAARRYGIETPDITLLPIGGVARLEKMPDEPRQELVVAVAGPLVNVVIVGILWLGLGMPPLKVPHIFEPITGSIPQMLLRVNMALVLFNMIPAFPMDGGRVFRALLAMRMDYARATTLAATVGQGLAMFAGFWGFMNGQLMLTLIAVFIFFGAGNEAAMAQLKNATSGLRVSSAMVTNFGTLTRHSTLREAADLLLRTSQHEFPILEEDGRVAGLLTQEDLITGLRQHGAEAEAVLMMRIDVPAVHQSMLFDRAFTVMNRAKCSALPVIDSAGRLIGLFTKENVGEMIMVQSALADASRRLSVPA